MGELIRASRKTFDVIESKIGATEVFKTLKARATILAAEVRFTIEPKTSDSLALALALEGHGQSGRMAGAIDRIRGVCLGVTATPAPTATSIVVAAITETSEQESLKVEDPKVETPVEVAKVEVAKVEERPVEAVKVVAAPVNQTVAAMITTNFQPWRSVFAEKAAELLAKKGEEKG